MKKCECCKKRIFNLICVVYFCLNKQKIYYFHGKCYSENEIKHCLGLGYVKTITRSGILSLILLNVLIFLFILMIFLFL